MRDLQRIGPRLLAVAMALLIAGCSEPRRMVPRGDVGYQSYGRSTSTRDGYARRSTAPVYRYGARQPYRQQAYRDPRAYSPYDNVATGGVPGYNRNDYAPGYNGSGYGQPGAYANGWNTPPMQPNPRQTYPAAYPAYHAYPAQPFQAHAYPAPGYPPQIYQPYPPQPYPAYPQQAYPQQPAYAPQPTYYVNPAAVSPSYASPSYASPPYDNRQAYPDAGENDDYSSLDTRSSLAPGNERDDLDISPRAIGNIPAYAAQQGSSAGSGRAVQGEGQSPPVSMASPSAAGRSAPRTGTLEAQAVDVDQGRHSPVASAPLAEKRRPPAPERRKTAPVKAKQPAPQPAAYRPRADTASLGQQAQTGSIRFLPIIGAPATVITPLARHLANAARAKSLVIKASTDDSSNHILKGYLAAFRNGDGVTVSYVWDVLDKAGDRLHRIQGKRDVAYAGGDLWAAVPIKTLQTIAEDTIAAYGQWRGTQRG